MLTLKEKFCLNKTDFSVSPEEDYMLYAGRVAIHEQMKSKIDEPFIRGRIPKMYLWGPYGGGKTHTLYHLQYYIKKNYGERVHTIIMNLGVLKRKTMFVDIFKRIMDNIGQTNLRKLVDKMSTKNIDSDDLDQVFIDFFADENVGRVFRKLSFRGTQEILAWKWLCGEKITSGELTLLEVPSNLTDVGKFTDILRKVGKLHEEIENKYLILLIDECEHLTNITDSDSVEDVKYAFRELIDKKNSSVGLIFAGTAEEQAEIGDELMLHESIIRRMNEAQGYFELSRFDELEDVQKFVADLLEYLIDRKCAESTLKNIGDLEEELTIDIYPFTKEGLELFISYILESPERMLPSVICEKLNDVSVNAIKNNKNLLTSEVVNDELY